MLVALLLACSSSAPEPVAPDVPASSPELQAHMQGHLTHVRQVREALGRGDLVGAKKANEAFLEHKLAFDLPGDWVPHVAAMGAAAVKLDHADDLATAATHSAAVVNACAGCHEAVGVEVELPRGAVATPAVDPAKSP